LTWWGGAADGKTRLMFNAGDWLYLLHPESGQPFESFGDHGRVRTGHFRVAPAIHENRILIAGYDGDAFAFDLFTGEKQWTFHTKPEPGTFGSDTWSRVESGANCWSGTALDTSRGIFFLTTGSPKPNFIGTGHLGDNLFSNCVIALNARTGERLWHFQEIRHDIWDLDIPAPPVLVSVERNGKRVDAVAAVTKIGNTLLLDRVSGQPLFAFRLRRAPVSKLHGERTSPYQPDLQWPQPFSRQRFGMDQITNLSEEARQSVLFQLNHPDIDIQSNMGWFEPFEAGKPTALFGIHGGAEWTGASFDPETGFLYVTSNELPWFPTVSRIPFPVDAGTEPATEGRKLYEQHCMACHGAAREGVGVNPPLIQVGSRKTEEEIRTLLKTGRNLMPAAEMLDASMTDAVVNYVLERDRTSSESTEITESRPAYTYNGYPKLLDHEGYPGCKPPWGTLNCIDLNHGTLRWQVPLGEHARLTEQGIPITGTENFGGATVTAGGLVFAAGTRDLKIRAFDKQTGEELWSHALPFGGFAPPSTYLANGRQFILIPATGGGKLGGLMGDAYVAFRLSVDDESF
jgi:quinoprotein glucose dehydrogenase